VFFNLPELYMQTNSNYCREFKELITCVIIPTYNNAKSLQAVILDVKVFCDDVIVVNDGSTDQTGELLQGMPGLQVVDYSPNKGKGYALKRGFAYALSKGFDYAISIDSDGQHFAKDLPLFLNELKQNKNAIIIGARNMNQESVPGGSSFGNRFSNFWFKVETGIRVSDTQSGYRLYPLKPLSHLRYFTSRYEFEIEVLVRAAWRGVKVVEVPVSVYYAPQGERVSHFRPVKDFFRISILNTVLVLISFLYIKPVEIIKNIWKKEFWQRLWELVIVPGESAFKKSLSLGLGVFMGIVPIWGFQLITAILLSVVFKLNKALVIIGANISIPPLLPFVLFGSYRLGTIWMGNRAMHLNFNNKITLQSIGTNLEQYIYGAITLAVLAGIFFGILSFVVIKIIPRKTAISG